jgi:hypothetical protein
MDERMLTSSLVDTRNQVSFESYAREYAHFIRISSLVIRMIANVPVVIDIHERIWSIVNCQPEDGDVIRVDNAVHAISLSALTREGYTPHTHNP